MVRYRDGDYVATFGSREVNANIQHTQEIPRVIHGLLTVRNLNIWPYGVYAHRWQISPGRINGLVEGKNYRKNSYSMGKWMVSDVGFPLNQSIDRSTNAIPLNKLRAL